MIFRRIVAGLTFAALLGCSLTGPAEASPPAWHDYVLGPDRTFVEPTEISSTSGDVSGAKSLLVGRDGSAVMTMESGGPEPVVILDFGRAVSGIPEISVGSVEGSPTLRASYSESGRYIDADGDNGGNGPCCGLAPPAAEPHRYNEWQPTGPQVLATTYLQGSQRFMRLALTTPGTVRIDSAGIKLKAFRGKPRDYRGWFLSSDRLLNRIWFSGAYTVQLDMVPPGVQDGNEQPQVVDGAKRDRAIWSGDLIVQNPVIWDTFGSRGAEYVKQSLISLADGADSGGALPGIRPLSGGGFIYSETYSMHAANAMVDYFRYTGDKAWARRVLPVVRKQLEFDQSLTDERGLIVNRIGVGPGLCCGLDWDGPYDGQKTGAVTATNVIFFHTLQQAAYLERQAGSAKNAAVYERQAKRLRGVINATLFDPATGLYRLSDELPDETGQDANSLAVLYGVAPVARRSAILKVLRDRLWTPNGTRPFSEGTGFSDVISPFASGFETGARFAAGDDAGALKMIRRTWGRMLRPGPDYSGAFWEKMNAEGGVGVITGADPVDNQSLAHGWSASPTQYLSEYVLGARPVKPGYRTWRIQPHFAELRWSRGRVPTGFGPIDLNWKRGGGRVLLRGRVRAPKGTSGKVILPRMATRQRVVVNHRLIRGRSFHAKGGQVLRIKVLRGPKKTKTVSRRGRKWVTAWNFSPSTDVPGNFSDQTIRTISYTHFGGSEVRIVLTNRFGERPVTFNSASVGVARGGVASTSPAIKPGTLRRLTFGGKRSVTIRPGQDRRSDPVFLRVHRGESVVTSVFTASDTGNPTTHTEAEQTSYMAEGDETESISRKAFSEIPDVNFGDAIFFLNRVEVRAGPEARTLVSMGDSLTNGTGSSLDRNGRYPDALARALARDPRTRNLAVANAGIGGNRILRDAPDYFPYGGPSGLHRLKRDVLSQPNVAGVLLIEGMNDIGSAAFDHYEISSGDVIAGLRTLAGRIHAAGKKVYVGTIPPTGDPEKPSNIPWYSTPDVDQKRREVNDFIRSGQVFDGWFEVDRTVRDPEATTRLLETYNSGDGLHPNDLGYRQIAKAIRPKMLAGLGGSSS